MARKVFLSFTGMLQSMRDGEVSDEDLTHGLFYFGCARVHVMGRDPGKLHEVNNAFPTDTEQGRETCLKLQQALVTAEAEGRVAWRPPMGCNSQEQLSKLLVANDAQPLNPNLPPVYELSFIVIAIDRANNKDGQVMLEPVY